MNFCKLHTAQVTSLKAHIIDIEVDIANGLHSFDIVGLADRAIEESKDRISAAIKNCGLPSPKSQNQKIIISLAPAHLKKEGPFFDLPLALGYLLASHSIEFNPLKKLFMGELSLDGVIRTTNGILAIAQEAKQQGFTELYVPEENAAEAALVEGITVFGVKSLTHIIAHLHTKGTDTITHTSIPPTPTPRYEAHETQSEHDFAFIAGQESAKHGLLIAAAGGHSVAMIGPPGTGKTMLARAFTSLLPALSQEAMLEVTAIHSVAGVLRETIITHPPFRAPHHTSSYVSLVGGGSVPKPGEITLAHRGVLFLDEFPEFERRVIDSLRQPLEEKFVSVSRSRGTAHFPADFILIAAMNPCPCGFYGVKERQCVCEPRHILSYKRKISGPITDRIDLWVRVEALSHETLSSAQTATGSGEFKEKVVRARALARARANAHVIHSRTAEMNSRIPSKQLHTLAPLTSDVANFFNDAALRLNLSARAYHRVWRVARTIADLDESINIEISHIAQALQYRPVIE